MDRALDLMSQDVVTLSIEEPIRSALKVFMEKKHVSIPILSVTNQVVGLLTEQAMVKGMVSIRGERNDNATLEEITEYFEPAKFVKPSDSFVKVIQQLVVNDVGRVIVADDEKRIMGIISPHDVLNRFAILET